MKDSQSANNVIVVAEDYPDISQLVGDILRDEGYEVVAVPRGSDVFPAVEEHHPVLVLLDLSLPDLTGNEVLRQLADNPTTCEIPVIIVSAYTEQLRSVPQVRAIVNKPFDLATLIEAVNQVRRPNARRA